MDDDAKDRVRFQLPMYVGARYGEAPSAVITGSQAHATTRVRIEATVHTQGTIKNVTSPTHSSLRSLSERNRSVPNHASVLYESSRFLQEDFVLLIDAQGLENPRGFVERHPQQKDSFAVQLTVVPRFNLPPIPSQEYIFLVDCSGSMGGDRIVTAKQSLSALLKSLPRKGTQFNIFRFGSTCTSFLGSSKAYDESTVRRAVRNSHRCTLSFLVYLNGTGELYKLHASRFRWDRNTTRSATNLGVPQYSDSYIHICTD